MSFPINLTLPQSAVTMTPRHQYFKNKIGFHIVWRRELQDEESDAKDTAEAGRWFNSNDSFMNWNEEITVHTLRFWDPSLKRLTSWSSPSSSIKYNHASCESMRWFQLSKAIPCFRDLLNNSRTLFPLKYYPLRNDYLENDKTPLTTACWLVVTFIFQKCAQQFGRIFRNPFFEKWDLFEVQLLDGNYSTFILRETFSCPSFSPFVQQNQLIRNPRTQRQETPLKKYSEQDSTWEWAKLIKTQLIALTTPLLCM
jgi:hypothetical protein